MKGNKNSDIEIMRLDKIKISLPIVNSESSKNYALILTDIVNVIHYFNFNGTYDGYSHNPEVCGETGINLN